MNLSFPLSLYLFFFFWYVCVLAKRLDNTIMKYKRSEELKRAHVLGYFIYIIS